jgi:peptidoglycan-associated lipoprotein
MRKTSFFLGLALSALASSAPAQLPGLRRYPSTPPQPVLQGIDGLRADFAAQSGGTTIYYGLGSSIIGAPARAVLAAQAAWLRRHPEVAARIEGYGDSGDTRDHALAVGARRAEEARSYLVLLGVPSAQLSITSLGKERPGLGRAVTVLVR